MSNETDTRPYRKRKRARQEEETRLRITEAVVELHRTVGPAKTKVTEVADLAGVSRMTVYNHFPTEADLIEACSAHWSAQNPFPDPAPWTAIDDPADRLRTALEDLYHWYCGTEDMMGNVLRDAPIVPALDEIMEARWEPFLEDVVRTLSDGWAGRDSDDLDDEDRRDTGRPELRAALRLAVDFHTWRTLARSGLSDERAAGVMAGMMARVADPNG